MNFLQLAQRLRSEAGVSGSGPTAVTQQTGELERLVNWINDAWEELQQRSPYWKFMRAEFAFDTTAGLGAYKPTDVGLADLKSWDGETLRSYLKSAGVGTEMYLIEQAYPHFRDTYLYGAMRSVQGQPLIAAVRPNDTALVLGPVPNAVFTITGEYRKRATRMTGNADLPGGGNLPEQHHMAIVHSALMKYARFEGAGALYQTALVDFKRALDAMTEDQLDMVETGEPLA